MENNLDNPVYILFSEPMTVVVNGDKAGGTGVSSGGGGGDMDENSGSKDGKLAVSTDYPVYARRWLILLLFVMYSTSNSFQRFI